MSAIAPLSPAWHEERRKGIGSSDAAAILGLSKFATPLDIYLEKIGEAEERPDTAFTEWGRRLEPVIAQAAEDAVNAGRSAEERVRFVSWTPAIHCRAWWPAFTHLDRRGRVDGAMVGLECKSGMGTRGWGDPATVSIVDAHEVIPPDYAIQVGHHLLCSGYAAIYVAALIGYREFRLYRVERDEAWLDDLLADEREWWEQHVVARVPPDPDGSRALRLRASAATEVPSATPEQQLIASRALAAKRDREAADARYREECDHLARSMGDQRGITAATWRFGLRPGRRTTAWQKVLGDVAPVGLDLAPVIEKHTKVGEPYFQLDPIGEEE